MWGKLKTPYTSASMNTGVTSETRNKYTYAVHFNSPGHKLSSLTILVLKQMLNPNLRKRRESDWTHHCHPSRTNLEFVCLHYYSIFLLVLHFHFFYLSCFFTCIIMLFFSVIGHCFFAFHLSSLVILDMHP